MTMYYNAGLNVMHMILHVESECYVRMLHVVECGE